MAAELVPYLVIGLAVAFAALWPAARLAAAGASRGAVVAYYGSMVGLGVALLAMRAGFRILGPILAIAYVIPFVLERLRRPARR